MKIYAFVNGDTNYGDVIAIALCEDGKILSSQVCLNRSIAKYDLGVVENSGRNFHDKYDRHCGKGNWTIEWLDEPEKNPEFMQLVEKLNVESDDNNEEQFEGI